MLLPLTASALSLDGKAIRTQPVGEVLTALTTHLRDPDVNGIVLLGPFGSGKSTICGRLATEGRADLPPFTVVPLRVVARHADVEQGLLSAIGPQRLAEARAGDRVLLLDGLDEITTTLPGGCGFDGLFQRLSQSVGPRWILTCRPGWFRTEVEFDPDQVDSLGASGVSTWVLDPLPEDAVIDALSRLPDARARLRSVAGMLELATSPVLFQAVHAALPYIEPGRPIHPWGVFDAWIRHALSTGPRHDEAVAALEHLAWEAFEAHDFSLEVPVLSAESVARAGLPESLRRALLVNELAGGLRFGHRSVYEFLLASRIAPQLRNNQGYGPDSLTGMRLTDAMRTFLVGRTGPMGAGFDKGAQRAWIPRGNFVAGGAVSLDERPLRIEHLAAPVWIHRTPVSNADWAEYLAEHPDDRVDANYLMHWGPERQVPADQGDAPVYNIWPEDADRFAAASGARLPTADEWEKAVRGIDGRRWPWGDHWKHAAVVADLGVPRPLSSRAFGAQGEAALYGAVGGVFEYTSSPWRNREGRGRVVMGGCFTHPAAVSRAGLRLSHKLSGNLKAGLRLAWDGDGSE
ncbi:MAG: SUMF1/EgtB/PvdO family nonheme iron enzyme [Myxococcota bacterium]